MATAYFVHVDIADMKRIMDALDISKDKSKLILRKAINDTAREASKYMYKEAHSEYSPMAASQQKAAVKVEKKATTSALAAKVTSTGPIKEVYRDYKYRALGRGGFSANINGSYKPIEKGSRKAFLVTYHNMSRSGMASEHSTIAIRKTEGRLPIHTVYGPAIPKQMGFFIKSGSVTTERLTKSGRHVGDLLQKNMLSSISRFLGGEVSSS